jgi:biopolymer transport protein ExbB
MNIRLLLSSCAFALALFTQSGVAFAEEGAAQTAQPATTTAAAPAAIAPVAATTTATKGAHGDTVTVDNPFGLQALWAGGDFIARGVLVMMLVMSMGSWYILVVKLLEQMRLSSQARAASQSFWGAPTVRAGAETLRETSPFRFLAEAGLEATKKHVGLLDHIDLNTWVTSSIQRGVDKIQSRMQGGLAFLATVGSTAPFIGLFGTVWGIYHALTAIGVAGQASIDKVAGPVGEALIMTAIGLAVAVPAVLGYNFLVRRNKVAMDDVRAFGSDLHAVLLASAARA